MSIILRSSAVSLKHPLATARLGPLRRLCSNEAAGNPSEVPKKKFGFVKILLGGIVGTTGLVGGLTACLLYDKQLLGRVEKATGMNFSFLHAKQKAGGPYLPFLGSSGGGTADSEKLSQSLAPIQFPSSSSSTKDQPALKGPIASEQQLKQQAANQPQTSAKPPAGGNSQLLSQLSSTLQAVEVAMESAVTKGIAAETKTKQYAQQLKRAMETKAESDWALARAAEAAKKEAIEGARQASTNAEKLLNEFKTALDNPKVQGTTAVKSGFAEYKTFRFELDSIRANTERAETEARIIAEYKAEADKHQPQQKQQLLRSEVESLLPLEKRGAGAELNRDDLQLLIAHAHSKILELQKQVEEFEERERRLVQQVIDKSAAAGAQQTGAAVERELKHQMLQWEEEKRKLTEQLRETWEQDLQQQLSRQAAAHTSHVTQLSLTLREQLGREHQAELRARLVKEHEEFEAVLSGWTARVRGIESAVEGRAAMLERAQRAQQLWLASHSLRSAVAAGRNFRASLDAVTAMAAALGRDDGAVGALTSALPKHCRVSSEEALTARFSRVKRACARVALVPETGGSLWLHLLSRLQASLVLRRVTKPLKPEDPVDPADPPSLYDWLDTAEAALKERGDLETAIRAMARLPGMARLLADDWICEARAHLEARQTAAALCALASAMGLDAATQHRLPAMASADA